MKGNLWMEIRSEKKKGLSYAEIGRKHHIDPRTAKKYAESEEVPKYTLKQKRPSKLDPYKDRSTGDFLKTIEFTKMENTKNCIAFL